MIDFIATDLQPFSIVKNTEFKLFVNKLNPQFILPCRQTLKEKFVKNYDTKRNDLIGEILQIYSKISLILSKKFLSAWSGPSIKLGDA